jgi:NADH:ubiquinone oxidoreductase subunit 2 (subunit N)
MGGSVTGSATGSATGAGAAAMPRAPAALPRPSAWAVVALLTLAAGAGLALAQLPRLAPQLLASGACALDGSTLFLLEILSLAALAAALLGLTSSVRPPQAVAVLDAALAAAAWAAAAAMLDLTAAALLWAAGWVLAAAAVGRSGEPERLEAAVKVQGLGAGSALVLVLGAALCAGLAGSTHVLEVGQLLGSLRDSSVLARAAVRALLVGLALAAAWVPFHLWAPDGLSAAPRPVALVLAVAAPLAAALALARLVFAFEPTLNALQFNWRGGIFAFAALTALVGGSVALVQRDAGRLVAYLTTVQCAELAPALVQTPGDARLLLTAAAAHLAALAPVWLALGAWSGAGGESTDFALLAGRGRARPAWALLWVAALALAAGFPGGVRFALRPALALAGQPPALWGLLLALSALVQWAVVVRLARALFLDLPAEPGGSLPVRGSPWRARAAWALVALALAAEIALAMGGRLSHAAPPGWQKLLPGG